MDVVDRGDGDVIRNAQAGIFDSFHGPECRFVTHGEHSREWLTQREQLLHLEVALARLAGRGHGLQGGNGLQTALQQRNGVAAQTVDQTLVLRRTRQCTDAPVAQVQQVISDRHSGGEVVGDDGMHAIGDVVFYQHERRVSVRNAGNKLVNDVTAVSDDEAFDIATHERADVVDRVHTRAIQVEQQAVTKPLSSVFDAGYDLRVKAVVRSRDRQRLHQHSEYLSSCRGTRTIAHVTQLLHRLQHPCAFGRRNARLAVERQRRRRDGDAGDRCHFANVWTVTPAPRPTPDGLSSVGRGAAKHRRTVPKLFRSVNSSEPVFRRG